MKFKFDRMIVIAVALAAILIANVSIYNSELGAANSAALLVGAVILLALSAWVFLKDNKKTTVG